MLQISSLEFSYNSKIVLYRCSLSLQQGEIVGLVGRNGAGKSTLMNCITGNLHSPKNSILIKGNSPDTQTSRSLTQYIASNEHLPQFLTGTEYINLIGNLYNCAISANDIDKQFHRYGMDGRQAHLIEDYSHGMQKKTQLISAFLTARPLLLIDETLNGLDVDAMRSTQKDLLTLKNKGNSILLCSHDFSYLAEICDRICLLESGFIADTIFSCDFRNNPHFVSQWAYSFLDENTGDTSEE